MGKWLDCKNCGSRIFIQEVETRFGKKWIPFQELTTLERDSQGRLSQLGSVMVEHKPFCGSSPQRQERRQSSQGSHDHSQTQTKSEPEQEVIQLPAPGEHNAYQANPYDNEH